MPAAEVSASWEIPCHPLPQCKPSRWYPNPEEWNPEFDSARNEYSKKLIVVPIVVDVMVRCYFWTYFCTLDIHFRWSINKSISPFLVLCYFPTKYWASLCFCIATPRWSSLDIAELFIDDTKIKPYPWLLSRYDLPFVGRVLAIICSYPLGSKIHPPCVAIL